MAYKLKHGKLLHSGTVLNTFPYKPTGYQESDAEKAARLSDRARQLELGFVYDRNGNKICRTFRVPGLEMDTAETLQADGLIKHTGDETTVYEPENLRVIAWQMSVNEFARAHGKHVPFPEDSLPVFEVPDGPGTVQ